MRRDDRLVELSSQEQTLAKQVADMLHEYHGGEYGQTEMGIKAEAAAIKYFNLILLAREPITFNTKYQHGRDGGVDFHFNGVAFDVKYAKNFPSDGIPTSRLRATSAQILIIASEASGLGCCRFIIEGMISASKLNLKQKLVREWELLPVDSLKKLFPKAFYENFGKSTRYIQPMVSAGEIVARVMFEAGEKWEARKSRSEKD